MANTSWLFVIFGESHLVVLYLTDYMVRSPCSELPFLESFLSKAVHFYPVTSMYGLVGGRLTSPLNNVTKSDDDPTSFTPVGNSADSRGPDLADACDARPDWPLETASGCSAAVGYALGVRLSRVRVKPLTRWLWLRDECGRVA
jgi:hypothetical protein